MKFDRIAITDMGPFKSVDLDLSALAGKITAVCGTNGAGKTTLLELFAGALYRECATRGTLASLATSRGASVEVTVVNGARHTVRQLADSISGKGESLVLDGAGAPVLDSAKVSAADKWVASHLPSAETLYASSFSVQGRRGFLDLSKTDRKALLIELLDIKRYERMTAAASERASAARGEIALLNAKLSQLDHVDLEQLVAAALAAQGSASQATEAVALARRSLERARAAAGDADRARELAEQRAAVSARVTSVQAQIGEVETRLANNRGLLGRAEEIRSAVARIAAIDVELARVDREALEAFTALRAHETAVDGLRREVERTAKAAAGAGARIATISQRLRDRDRIAAAAQQVDALQASVATIETQFAVDSEAVTQAQHTLLAGKDERIAGLRDGLEQIQNGDPETAPMGVWAASALAQDDERAVEAERAPGVLADANKRVSEGRVRLAAAQRAVSDAQALAARQPEIDAAERELAQAQVEQQDATAARTAAVEAFEAAQAPHPTRAIQERLVSERGELDAERATLAPAAQLAARLDQAVARVEELDRQLAQQRETLFAAERELSALPVVDVQTIDVASYERELAAREQGAREAHAASTRAQDAVKTGEETIAKRAALATEVAEAETRLADYTRLAQDLGRDGLQLMEIDSALPELAALTNRLLHECCSTRFTVLIRTDRLSADGKRMLDGLDVVVLDTQNGREATAETYSGGEVVLINSALSLALTTLACRRAGIESPTVFLDEAGAALDEENGRAWLRMLRLAVEQIGASRLLYISHSAELQGLADSRIVVANGTAVIA